MARCPCITLRDFTVQFSVFSNQFLLAALNRVINADTLHAGPRVEGNPDERAGRHLQQGRERPARAGQASTGDHDREGDPALVSTEGTVDGGKFRFQAAHIEWLLRFGEPLGLNIRRYRQAAPRHSEHASFLRRAVPAVRQRRLQRSDGRVVRRRELGGRRILERTDCGARKDQGQERARSAARVLHVARQD